MKWEEEKKKLGKKLGEYCETECEKKKLDVDEGLA